MSMFSDSVQPLVDERVAAVDKFTQQRLTGDSKVAKATRHLPSAGGKRLRPLVCCFSAEALGTDYDDVVPAAAGIEALHVSTLICDDHPLMDDDACRRGVAAVHEEYDPATAILASNVLESKAFRWAMDAAVDTDAKQDIVDTLDITIEALCEGQNRDLSFEEETDISEQEYLTMVAGKTAALYEASARIGGIAASADTATVSRLAAAGHQLGLCFQMIDDAIDYNTSETGKTAYSDLRNKRPTLVNIHAARNDVPVYDDSYTVDERAALVRGAGSVEYVREQATTHAKQSKGHLDSLPTQNEDAAAALDEICEVALTRVR